VIDVCREASMAPLNLTLKQVIARKCFM
jgi:hypothetical protein